MKNESLPTQSVAEHAKLFRAELTRTRKVTEKATVYFKADSPEDVEDAEPYYGVDQDFDWKQVGGEKERHRVIRIEEVTDPAEIMSRNCAAFDVRDC